jgi:dihydroorotate dehydrogenase electron transfer subunit
MRAGPTRTTTGNRGEELRLLETRSVLPGWHLLEWEAPGLARRLRPGQVLALLAPRGPGGLLPVLTVAAADRVAGRLSVLLHDADDQGPASGLLRLHPGDTATVEGPLGRGFELDPRSRFLLVVAEGTGIAAVLSCVGEAVLEGRQVTLLLGARSVASVLPSSLLPAEAEYVVVTEDGSLGHHGTVTDLVPAYEAWADQCVAAGPPDFLERMAALAGGRDGRLGVARLGRKRGRRPEAGPADTRRRSWLQVVLPLESACALGICLGCVVAGSVGLVRTCREGPAFAGAELRWASRP